MLFLHVLPKPCKEDTLWSVLRNLVSGWFMGLRIKRVCFTGIWHVWSRCAHQPFPGFCGGVSGVLGPGSSQCSQNRRSWRVCVCDRYFVLGPLAKAISLRLTYFSPSLHTCRAIYTHDTHAHTHTHTLTHPPSVVLLCCQSGPRDRRPNPLQPPTLLKPKPQPSKAPSLSRARSKYIVKDVSGSK